MKGNTMSPFRSGRPRPGEYADYAQPDIDAIPGDDVVETLAKQIEDTVALFGGVDEDAATRVRYAPGKWCLKQIAGHLADDERIFAYRALCIARGDERPLPGFDQNEYMNSSPFDSLPMAQLLGELRIVRAATVSLLQGLAPEAWLRKGTVNGYAASVRGLAFHIAGHELHHLKIVRERYLPLIGA
jgi:hypothetical protein